MSKWVEETIIGEVAISLIRWHEGTLNTLHSCMRCSRMKCAPQFCRHDTDRFAPLLEEYVLWDTTHILDRGQMNNFCSNISLFQNLGQSNNYHTHNVRFLHIYPHLNWLQWAFRCFLTVCVIFCTKSESKARIVDTGRSCKPVQHNRNTSLAIRSLFCKNCI